MREYTNSGASVESDGSAGTVRPSPVSSPRGVWAIIGAVHLLSSITTVSRGLFEKGRTKVRGGGRNERRDAESEVHLYEPS